MSCSLPTGSEQIGGGSSGEMFDIGNGKAVKLIKIRPSLNYITAIQALMKLRQEAHYYLIASRGGFGPQIDENSPWIKLEMSNDMVKGSIEMEKFDDDVFMYASVSRTTSVVFTLVFDAHHHHTYTGYEYSA